MYDDDYDDWDDDGYRIDFADPGGGSALRAATRENPRNLPCPTCGWPNRLTPADRARGYQCDSCANALERGTDINYYDGDMPDDDEPAEEGPDFACWGCDARFFTQGGLNAHTGLCGKCERDGDS